jgi:electron transport complex protein RnfG
VLKIKHFIQQSWLLIVAAFCFGLLIAATNTALSDRIEQNKINKLNRLSRGILETFYSLSGVELPDNVDFKEFAGLGIKSLRGKKTTAKIYRVTSSGGECFGWSFNAVGSGWADKIEVVVAVDKNFGKLAGFDVLVSSETPNFGAKIGLPYYRDQFVGAPAEELKLVPVGDAKKIDSEIVAITRATISSQAVVDIINNTLTQIKEHIQKQGLIGDGEEG